jgi:hypothetical protein
LLPFNTDPDPFKSIRIHKPVEFLCSKNLADFNVNTIWRIFLSRLLGSLLKEADHAAQGVGHPVVGLLEGEDEDVHVTDLILQNVHQVLNCLLLLQQVIAETYMQRELSFPCILVAVPDTRIRHRADTFF